MPVATFMTTSPARCAVARTAQRARVASGHRRTAAQAPLHHHPRVRKELLRRAKALSGTVENTSALLSEEPAVVIEETSAFGPPTVANLGPGFDWLGCAVEGAGDVVTATVRRDIPGKVVITSIEGDNGRLSLETKDNCCGIAAVETLKLLGVSSVGVELKVYKGLPLGSGLGSSAASAAAAAWAVNSLFGAPLTRDQLVPAGLESEAMVSGYHADNIAPAIMGGFVLVRSYEPLTLISLSMPASSEACFVLVTPVFEAPTREMRAALPTEIPFKAHIQDSSAGAGLIAGICLGDAATLGSALNSDTLVEPARGPIIPGFFDVKKAALDTGALGCTISGAGPTVVAVIPNAEAGNAVADAMMKAFEGAGLETERALIAKLNDEGVRSCEPGMQSTLPKEGCISLKGGGCLVK